jgi:hypothetical protein
LRELTERCEQLADKVDAGLEPPQRLISEVTRLREGFEAHRRGKQHESGVFEDDGTTTPMPARGLGLSPTSELRLVLSAMRSHLASDRCAVTVIGRRR